MSVAPSSDLVPGRIYSWEELGARFGFSPGYLSAAGGMISRPDQGALLLITYPGGAKSFDYKDEWKGDALIYTGRGKVGDQQFIGPNLDLAENTRTNYVFEGGVGARALQYVGIAHAARYWRARGDGADGVERGIIRYWLEFDEGGRTAATKGALPARQRSTKASRTPPVRSRRPFDPSKKPSSYSASLRTSKPEDTAALQEKANHNHHALLRRLHAVLNKRGWSDITEIPGAIDLEASRGDLRVMFEAKVITVSNELSQVRSGLAQLLEYRFFHGEPDDRLCLITTRPIADRRIRFLEDQGVAVAYWGGLSPVPCGSLAPQLLGALDDAV